MTRPRQSPPTIQIGTQRRRMAGNAKDGYRLQVDPEFKLEQENRVARHVGHLETRLSLLERLLGEIVYRWDRWGIGDNCSLEDGEIQLSNLESAIEAARVATVKP